MEEVLPVKSGNADTIIKQMRLVAHISLAFGTSFTDALSKMVERKHVIALFAVRCRWNATRKFVACMQLHGLVEE